MSTRSDRARRKNQLQDEDVREQLQGKVEDSGSEVDAEDDPNDDVCAVCNDGGLMIVCDHCPHSYHKECIGMADEDEESDEDDDEWNCAVRLIAPPSESASVQRTGYVVAFLFSLGWLGYVWCIHSWQD